MESTSKLKRLLLQKIQGQTTKILFFALSLGVHVQSAPDFYHIFAVNLKRTPESRQIFEFERANLPRVAKQPLLPTP